LNCTGLHGIIQEVEFFIATVIRISDLTKKILVFLYPDYLMLYAVCHIYKVYIWKEILSVQFGEILLNVGQVDF
jgi:hypothetical protein